MKKILSLLALVLFGCMGAWADYTVNVSGNASRPMNTLCLNEQQIDVSSNRAKYQDLTSSVSFTITTGETVTPKILWGSHWLAGYVYVDVDQNGSFNTTTEGASSTLEGDFVSICECINRNGTYNKDRIENFNTFTINTSGTYRMRYKVDWNNANPNTIADETAQIIDVTLNVVNPTVPNAYVYAIKLKDTSNYFTTNWVATNANQTYSINSTKDYFSLTNTTDNQYKITSVLTNRKVGWTTWYFSNMESEWRINDIEGGETTIYRTDGDKGIGTDATSSGSGAYTDKSSGNYKWIFEKYGYWPVLLVDAPAGAKVSFDGAEYADGDYIVSNLLSATAVSASIPGYTYEVNIENGNVVVTFTKVGIDATFTYRSTSGATWSINKVVSEGTLDINDFDDVDYYTNFAFEGSTEASESNKNFTITCEDNFPFVVGQYCRIHNIRLNGDFYVKNGNESFTYATTSNQETLSGDIAYWNGEAPANSDIWCFEHVAGTQDAFLVKNYLTGKYLTFQYVNNGRCAALMETTAIESMDADKTSAMRVRKSTASNKGENGFVLQHPKYDGLCCSVHVGNGQASEPKVVSSWKANNETAALSNETNTLSVLPLNSYSTNLAATDGTDYYGSIYLPYTMTLPAGVEAYAAAQEDNVLKLTKVGDADAVIPEGAYILYGGTSVTSAVLTLGAQATVPAGGNVLTGKFEANVALPTGSNYVLNDKNNVVGFYKYNKTTYPVAKAVFCAGESSSNAFTFRFEDVVTAIDAIHSNNSGAEIFDLQGRRLAKAQQGMNIINGHKVLVK